MLRLLSASFKSRGGRESRENGQLRLFSSGARRRDVVSNKLVVHCTRLGGANSLDDAALQSTHARVARRCCPGPQTHAYQCQVRHCPVRRCSVCPSTQLCRDPPPTGASSRARAAAVRPSARRTGWVPLIADGRTCRRPAGRARAGASYRRDLQSRDITAAAAEATDLRPAADAAARVAAAADSVGPSLPARRPLGMDGATLGRSARPRGSALLLTAT